MLSLPCPSDTPAPLPTSGQTAASRDSLAASVSASGRLFSWRTRRWWYMWRADGDAATAGAIEWRPVKGEFFIVLFLVICLLSHLATACLPPTGGMAVKAGSSHGRYGCGRTAVGAQLHPSASMSRIRMRPWDYGHASSQDTATKHSRGGLAGCWKTESQPWHHVV